MTTESSYPQVYHDKHDPVILYVRDENTAFFLSFNPISRPRPGEESWPLTNLDKITGVEEVKKTIHAALNPDTSDPDPDMHFDAMDRSGREREDVERMEKLILKYGESYNVRADYDRVFAELNTATN